MTKTATQTREITPRQVWRSKVNPEIVVRVMDLHGSAAGAPIEVRVRDLRKDKIRYMQETTLQKHYLYVGRR